PDCLMVTSIAEGRRGQKVQLGNGNARGKQVPGRLQVPQPALKGAKAFVVGIADDSSIAYGCAKAFHELGADLAMTYLTDKTKPYVEPLAKELKAPLFLPLDFAQEGALEAAFEQISQTWGRLDILVHSAAFAPKEDLQGGLLNCSAQGFCKAMDIS